MNQRIKTKKEKAMMYKKMQKCYDDMKIISTDGTNIIIAIKSEYNVFVIKKCLEIMQSQCKIDKSAVITLPNGSNGEVICVMNDEQYNKFKEEYMNDRD